MFLVWFVFSHPLSESFIPHPNHKDHSINFAPGPNCYRHCQAHVEAILLVSDNELLEAMFLLHRHGLLVEPSGAAAFAALLHRKLPLAPGSKVVVVVTGGNVTPEEIIRYREQLDASKT